MCQEQGILEEYTEFVGKLTEPDVIKLDHFDALKTSINKTKAQIEGIEQVNPGRKAIKKTKSIGGYLKEKKPAFKK